MTDARPPHGIKPKGLWLQDRAVDLADTISRYLNSGILMPRISVWITELDEILTQLSSKQAEAIQIPFQSSLGILIVIRFCPDSEFYKNGVTEKTHRNVTQLSCIHHESGIDSFAARISLASDIHHTGCSYKLNDVKNYSMVVETEKADSF